MTTTPDIIDPKNKLALIIEENHIEPVSGQAIIEAFGPMFGSAQMLVDEADKIAVTDATQVTEIKRSRVLRLKLREIRITAEGSRKKFKEESLRRGKAIDGIANLLKLIIEPAEERKKAEAATKAAEAAARKEREAIEAKAAEERRVAAEAARVAAENARKEREAAEAEARKERESREKMEREIAAKKESEEKAKRQAERAPDKEKLQAFANEIRTLLGPYVKAIESRRLLDDALEKLERVAVSLEAGVNSL